MILISYDISDDKKRAKCNKYIKIFGHMLQYSVYEIDNSNKILNGIIADINNKFIKMFDETDSVYIFKLSESCETIKFGYARHDDSDLLIVE